MKKIIALAVATAFVTPAFAADVAVTGTLSQYLINEESTSSSLDRTASESNIAISASSEGANGLSISGKFTLTQDGNDYYGEGITVSHASIGKIQIGNPAGAIDAVDDKAEVLELMDATSGHKDSTVLWTLPSFVEGLTLNLSYAPKDAQAEDLSTSIVNGFTNYDMQGTSAGDRTAGAQDESGFSAQYSLGGVQIAYGQSNYASDIDASYIGVKYSNSGLMVAIDNSEFKQQDGTNDDVVAIGATYTMGAISVRGITSTYKDNGTKTKDRTAYGVHYDLGGGATLILETGKEDVVSTKDQFTGVGIRYKF